MIDQKFLESLGVTDESTVQKLPKLTPLTSRQNRTLRQPPKHS